MTRTQPADTLAGYVNQQLRLPTKLSRNLL